MLLLMICLAVLLCAMMTVGWMIQMAKRNGGWTDVVWSYVVGIVGFIGATWPLDVTFTPRQWLAAALVAAWSLRLGTHLAIRVSRHEGEEVRYAHLRQKWGRDFDRRMFGLLQIQAAAAFPLVASVAVAAHRPGQALGLQDALAVLIFAAALGGEVLADRQPAAFGKDPANAGKVFEWAGWLAWPVMAISPGWGWGWLALSGPLVMYLLVRSGRGRHERSTSI